MAEQRSGRIRKKKVSYSQISNHILRNKNLSLKAKGLAGLIESYLTLDDFVLYKDYLEKQSSDGKYAFDGAWKELKKNGYLIQHQLRDEHQRYIYEYELVDVPNCTVVPFANADPSDSKQKNKTPSAKPPEVPKPDTDFPGMEIPPMENPPLENPGAEKPGMENPGMENPPAGNPDADFPWMEGPPLVYPDTVPPGLDFPCGGKPPQYNNTLLNNTLLNNTLPGYTLPTNKQTYRENVNLLDVIHQNIDYDTVFKDSPYVDIVDNIVAIMLEVFQGKTDAIQINKMNMPVEVVRGILLKVNMSHINYVVRTIQAYPKRIANARKFILSTLYNSVLTLDTYYTNQVTSDYNQMK